MGASALCADQVRAPRLANFDKGGLASCFDTRWWPEHRARQKGAPRLTRCPCTMVNVVEIPPASLFDTSNRIRRCRAAHRRWHGSKSRR